MPPVKSELTNEFDIWVGIAVGLTKNFMQLDEILGKVEVLVGSMLLHSPASYNSI